MSNYKVDNNQTFRDSSGHEIGKVDYSGEVWDGSRTRGSIENDRYTDEYGVDRGWVRKHSGSSSSGASGLALIGIILVFGLYYLIYLGIKWLIVEGKKSKAHASRSWGVASMFFPPFFIIALKKGNSALLDLRMNGDPDNLIKFAKTGVSFGYVGLVLFILAIIALITSAITGNIGYF